MIEQQQNNVVRVFESAENPQIGRLFWQGVEYPCALGRGGIVSAVNKREGDGCTPAGIFPLRNAYYRNDKLERPDTQVQIHALTPTDGWCDDPSDKNYNCHVSLPYPTSAENLWRDDDCYDLLLTIGYNDQPVRPHKGSAVFVHVARPNLTPTRGCVALSETHLLEVLKTINSNTLIRIHLPPMA